MLDISGKIDEMNKRCDVNEMNQRFVVMFRGFRDVSAKIVRRGRLNLKVIQR